MTPSDFEEFCADHAGDRTEPAVFSAIVIAVMVVFLAVGALLALGGTIAAATP